MENGVVYASLCCLIKLFDALLIETITKYCGFIY
ncbi:hypothetical protein Dtox_2018 [Desulfofarcimen acetoxidans DSM 771]|uniref:Uncharacterized protein n=1 Tax=Desulfofarcimen acetoxidans (strain ATCC 49208 / DSM 771 / KCTC 5769 / VKM B-1644 / 5575) TaxID=485916 RepID=C8VYH2_DESAS|nr:hypothetical protein Dtox_2018 [Desulfofarcimen acetoxidans DSM 771]